MYGFSLKIEHGQFVINGVLIEYQGNGRPYEFPNGVVITKNYRQVNNGRFIEGYYPGGTQIEISVQPFEGYGFVGWEGIESNESVLIKENTNFNLKTICLPTVCPDDDCWVKLYTDFEPDPNGYYHVTTQWDNESSGRFNIHIESAPTKKECQYGGVPYILSRFRSTNFKKELTSLLKAEKFDTIILESLFTSSYLNSIKQLSQAKIIYRSHNIEYLIWESQRDNALNFLTKKYLRLQARRLKKEEMKFWNEIECIASISNSDNSYSLTSAP